MVGFRTLGLLATLVTIVLSQKASQSGVCKTVVWLSDDPAFSPEYCFPIKDKVYWYGGGSVSFQTWPLKLEVDDGPQVTGGDKSGGSTNRIHNRIWFNTENYAIKVEDNVPLFVNVTERGTKLCMRAENKVPYRFSKSVPATLSYSQCYASDFFSLYETVMPIFFELPQNRPDKFLMEHPVWSTFPAIKTGVNATSIKQFVSNITDVLGLKSGTIIVNHGWEACIGEHKFATSQFVNPKNFFDDLKSKGFKVSVKVHPHISEVCSSSYTEAYNKGYLVLEGTSGKPGVTNWEGSKVSSVNFLNDAAAKWFKQRLTEFRTQSGFDSYFFDRGQASLLSNDYKFSSIPMASLPDAYTTKYAEVAASFGDNTFINVGRDSQKYPMFVQMLEKMDSFQLDGLNTVIPSLFQMQISGFPFVLPEVAGGSITSGDDLPDRILYIRWLQLNTLLPIMHLSIPPWAYDDQVVQIAKDMIEMRKRFYDNIFNAVAQTVDATPMIRPVFWGHPDSAYHAFDIDDEFMVGDSLLVAPILDRTTTREIYLPTGKWRDNLRNVVHDLSSPGTLTNYEVKLNELATFTKLLN